MPKIMSPADTSTTGPVELTVCAPTLHEAEFVAQVFKSQGMTLGHQCKVRYGIRYNAVEIVIKGKVSSDDNSMPITTLLATSNPAVLHGIGVSPLDSTQKHSLAYLCPNTGDGSGIAIPLSVAAPFRTRPPWREYAMLLGLPHESGTIAAECDCEGVRTLLCGIDLLALLDYSLLGSLKSDCRPDDWAEAFCTYASQSLATHAWIDELFEFLISWMFMSGCSHRHSLGCLLITGDSDDASPSQLDAYFRRLNSLQLHGCVLIKDFDRYSTRQLREAGQQGHCFGIHPYAEDGTTPTFVNKFHNLEQSYRAVFDEPIYAVRSHRFQRIERGTTYQLARDAGVLFDFNCVAASGKTWCGTACGIGTPLPFPPLDSRFSVLPLHLPTVIEDDVFLFEYGYCYRAFASGDRLPIDCALNFLDDWVLCCDKPAVINVHPEHVETHNNHLFEGILEWCERNRSRMCGLRAFAKQLGLQAASPGEPRLDMDST